MAIIGPFDFRGGFSPGYDFTTLPQNHGYATVMNFCRIKAGYVAPYWGVSLMNTSPANLGGSVKGMTTWRDTVNAVVTIVATANSKLWASDDVAAYIPETGTSVTWTDRTGALAAASLSGNTTFDFLNNILVGSANSASSGAIFKMTAYNANGAALGGSPPSGDIVKQCNNFMFISRNLSGTTTQSKVYWSNVNDPETWTAANVLDFNKNDGEPIMALGSIGTDLYIFKKTSIGRLSTVTITTSGAVTLGPLVTVIRGIGCCGPLALDNLPSGNIVFIGFDGHFYEFDGSTVIDRSRQPFPEPNCFEMGQYYAESTYNRGLSDLIADVTVRVKTLRGVNEVWISSTTSHSLGTPVIFIYSFGQTNWQGVIGSGFMNSTAFTTLPNTAFSSTHGVESSDFLIHGNPTGEIFANGNSLTGYPMTDSNPPIATSFFIGTTIQFSNSPESFIPRSLCVEVNNKSSVTDGFLSFLKIYADLDVYQASTLVYTSSTGQLAKRIVVPLNFKQDSIGTNVFPSFISVMFEGKGTGSGSTTARNPEILRIGKFWLSDEIIR